MILHFTVNEQSIAINRASSASKVVANSQNYLNAAFSFSEEWSGVITAVFEHPTVGAKAVLIGSDGSCFVPWEVIQPPFFYVGAFCGSRITSNKAQVFVKESVALDTEATTDPTPTVYEQIIALLEGTTSGTGIVVEKDPTVPSWVKAIQQTDIEHWNHPPDTDLSDYLTESQSDERYQPVGEYQPAGDYLSADSLTGYLTKEEAAADYQPVGDYQPAGIYQPAGEYLAADSLTGYLTKEEATTTYQPVGNYQPAGSYMKTTDTLNISRLRDTSEDNTYGSEISSVPSNSLNRLFYFKSDQITNANAVYRTGAYGVRNTDTSMPYLQWWYMICFCKNEEMKICVQWAFPVRQENNGELWIRTCRGEESYYGEWKRIATTEQLTALEARIAALEARLLT